MKNVASCAIFAVLLIMAILKCADVLEYKEAREKYTPFFEADTNFDVIFLGTSHMYNHVLPMEMWNDYGIASYNWGYSNCTPAENYYLIQDIVKYTSPKVVVMDVYGLVEYEGYNNGKYRTDRIEQQHVQFDSFPIWSASKYRASKDVFDDYANNIDFVWNFIMYHNRWTELGQRDFKYDIKTEKGARFLTGLGTATFSPIPENEKTTIDSICLPYYLKTIEFCQERGIEVLCVYIPFAANEEQQKVANSIGDIVKEYPNCRYVNMLTKDVLDFNTDITFDNVHLNYSGAVKVTEWLGQYLNSNYTLKDYRDDLSWEKDFLLYKEYKRTVLKSETSLASYLVQLKDDYLVEAEIYDSGVFESNRIKALFDNAGIIPKYLERDTDKCARLVIKDKDTNEIIDDTSFICENIENLEINAVD